MIITSLKLKNWRNFRDAEIDLAQVSYIVGPNASGKSNLLDVFRFIRDICRADGGGLQKAVKDRGYYKAALFAPSSRYGSKSRSFYVRRRTIGCCKLEICTGLQNKR